MAANPNGTGLIPGDDDDQDQDDVGNDTDDTTDDDIDAPPPPDDTDGDDENDDDQDDGGEDLEARFNAFEERMQKRFDRAITKAVQNAQRSAPQLKGQDDNDGDDDQKQRPAGRSSVPTSTVRLLIRDRLSEELEGTGQAERRATRAILDAVVPHVQWDEDDAEDKVDELAKTVAEQAKLLVNAGSERKVKQLRGMGLLPERKGQPAASSGKTTQGDVNTSMKKGQDKAKLRWPEGRRARLGS
jgi:hypothetical protein